MRLIDGRSIFSILFKKINSLGAEGKYVFFLSTID